MRRGQFFNYVPHLETLGKAPLRCPQKPLIFWLTKETVYNVFMTPQEREPFLTAFLIDGYGLGGCDSARAVRLGSHAARGGRGGRSSASTMRVVVMARLADALAAGGAAGASQQFLY